LFIFDSARVITCLAKSYVMDGGNERRVATKFCFKASLSATKTPVLVQKTYRNKALNRTNVFRWYSRFRDGREPVENDERSSRPKSTRTEVNITAVTDFIENDRRIASRMIAEPSNIPKTSSSDSQRGFGKQKVVCKFCSTFLDT